MFLEKDKKLSRKSRVTNVKKKKKVMAQQLLNS